MKEHKSYVCDYCNTQYADKQMAIKCEKNHKIAEKICNERYLPITVMADGVPEYITVEFKGGLKVRYRRG